MSSDGVHHECSVPWLCPVRSWYTQACSPPHARALPARGAPQVLHRLVPLARGLFEDHVANFWCVSSVLIKWKRLLPVPASRQAGPARHGGRRHPPLVHQALRPSREGLLLALLNSSFAFSSFAFQGQCQPNAG